MSRIAKYILPLIFFEEIVYAHMHTHTHRTGNEELLMALLTPLNVNCHAADGRKVSKRSTIAALLLSACLPTLPPPCSL